MINITYGVPVHMNARTISLLQLPAYSRHTQYHLSILTIYVASLFLKLPWTLGNNNIMEKNQALKREVKKREEKSSSDK